MKEHFEDPLHHATEENIEGAHADIVPFPKPGEKREPRTYDDEVREQQARRRAEQAARTELAPRKTEGKVIDFPADRTRPADGTQREGVLIEFPSRPKAIANENISDAPAWPAFTELAEGIIAQTAGRAWESEEEDAAKAAEERTLSGLADALERLSGTNIPEDRRLVALAFRHKIRSETKQS